VRQQPAFPVNAALAQPAQPKVRAQSPDTAGPIAGPLALPSPEALGVAPAKSLATGPARTENWNDLHARLRRLGPVGFRLDPIGAGQWRATLSVPQGAQGTRHLQAEAASEADAAASVLGEAEAILAPR
jgi:hypothetical protein